MGNLQKEVSPQRLAKLGGALYLVGIVVGIFNQAVVKGRIVVAGDAAATAANLRSMEWLWRLGIAGEMVMVLSTIVLAFILYLLLRPVSRDLALLATFFNLIAIGVQAAYSLRLVEALFPLGTARYLETFSAPQRQALAALALRSHGIGFGIVLLFFGPFFLLSGYLIRKAAYLPTAVGALYQLAGLAYLANGFVLVLAPRLAGQAFAAMVVPVFVGEASFCLWLLFRGVDLQRWAAQTEVWRVHAAATVRD